MARSTFGGSAADAVWATVRSGSYDLVVSLGGLTVTMWSAETGGTQYTDLLDAGGSPVTSITAAANGQLPQFQGPDGVTSLWADAGGGRVRLNTASALTNDAIMAGVVEDTGSDFRTAMDGAFVQQVDRTAMLPWTVAAANRTKENARILVLGDSIAEGSQVSTILNRWTDRLRDRLRAALPVNGVTIGGTTNYIPAWYYAPNNPGTAKFTAGGTPTQPASFGLGLRSYALSKSGDQLSIPVTGTSFKVLYATINTGGTFSVSIDGGTATNVNIQLAGVSQDGTQTASFPLTAGSHTVTIAWVSGGPVVIDGLLLFDGDENAGIRVIEAAHGGFMAQDYVSITAKQQSLQYISQNLKPHLVIIALGTNDLHNNKLPSDFYTYTMTAISSIRTGNSTPPPSILLLGQMDSPDLGNTYTAQDYRDQYAAIAAADSRVAYLDMSKIMPASGSDDLSLYYTDKIHPVDRGYGLYAEAVAEYLLRAANAL